jgi:BirA family biotin operon repressor/biotin-[acetyl-CoA-carboxylase] ligase
VTDWTAELSAPQGPASRVCHLPEVDSTNTYLVDGLRTAPEQWPDRSVVITDQQTAGRGRAGRSWVTGAGDALTYSVAVDCPEPAVLPLLAGLAVRNTVMKMTGLVAATKWPNDILLSADTAIDGWGYHRKLGGVLCELVTTPRGPVVVVGIGVNLAQEIMPVPHATSLRAAGVEVDRADFGRAVLVDLFRLIDTWRQDADEVFAELTGACVTIGAQVQVSGPTPLVGTATGLRADGALLVASEQGVVPVLAGDVQLRV